MFVETQRTSAYPASNSYKIAVTLLRWESRANCLLRSFWNCRQSLCTRKRSVQYLRLWNSTWQYRLRQRLPTLRKMLIWHMHHLLIETCHSHTPTPTISRLYIPLDRPTVQWNPAHICQQRPLRKCYGTYWHNRLGWQTLLACCLGNHCIRPTTSQDC